MRDVAVALFVVFMRAVVIVGLIVMIASVIAAVAQGVSLHWR